MTAEAWITLIVVAATVVTLARELLAPAATVVGAMIVLLVSDVITPEQALSGFSNPAPASVAALYVVAAAVERTGLLGPAVNALLGRGTGERRALVRLTLPAAGSSAFLNNTPIVAALIPVVGQWCTRHGAAVSRFLMPLSFAAILGGVVTTIGTSTNLVVSGLLSESGGGGLDVFEITPLGLPVAVAGMVVVVLLTPSLLPARRGAHRQFADEYRQFMVQMVVQPDGPLDGQNVEQGGLRHLQGVFLVEIQRGDQRIAPVSPETVLEGGDELTFVGRSDMVVDLQRERGLRSSEHHHLLAVEGGAHSFHEAVIGAESPLAGRTLKEVEFRARYQAAVVAIHRAGEPVRAKLGEVRLRAGDTLLLLAGPDFRGKWGDRRDFLLVARLDGPPPTASAKAPLSALILVGVVALAATGALDILKASLLGAVAVVAFGILTPGEARDSVDLDVLVLIAASFGIGEAVAASGLAGDVAGGLVDLFGGMGDRGVLLGVVLATVVLTELITNNAAAVLMFPIALAAAGEAGIDPTAMAIAVAVSASASFLTPIGYQTNTMVYGPGGYRFGDYARLGAPVTLVVIATVVLLTPVVL